MTRSHAFALATAATLVAGAAPALTVTDVVDSSDNSATVFFAPSLTAPFPAGVNRGRNDDWGWQHASVSGTIVSATVQITGLGSLLFPHRVYAFDGASQIELGALTVSPLSGLTTTFTLASSLFDDIGTGLRLFVDISSGQRTGPNQRLALLSSTLTVTQPDPPPPPPAVPLPASVVLLGGALAGLAALRRRA